MKIWFERVKNWLNKEENNDLEHDYKIVEQRRKIDKLTKEIVENKKFEKERTHLLELREKRIHDLTESYTTLKNEIKNVNQALTEANEYIEKLEKKLEIKEHQRRQNASTIGAKQAKINRLEKKIQELNKKHELEILSKNATIEYLKRHRRAPDIEEIKAYEYQRKEVEKRMK